MLLLSLQLLYKACRGVVGKTMTGTAGAAGAIAGEAGAASRTATLIGREHWRNEWMSMCTTKDDDSCDH